MTRATDAPSQTTTTTQTAVPYVDLVAQHEPLRREILDAVARVLDHGQFILGPEVERFEEAFASYCGVRHAIGVGNGTDALVLALRAVGVGPGDEVITAPNSFIATASAIRLVGATPTLADVRDDLNIDPDAVERAITDKTRAIMPVHLTGRPAAMDPLGDIAADHGIKIIEDAAQAIGARYHGRRVGNLGDVGCFSLHPLKTLNACGDAGIITTNDDAIAAKLRQLRNLGLRTRDDCAVWSGNSRLDTMQAAILGVKLPHVDTWTRARQTTARRYQEALGPIPGITVPEDETGIEAAYHTFVIQTNERDRLLDALQTDGIGTAIHYPIPIHLQSAAHELGHQTGAFPVAEQQADRILSLPIHQDLSPEQVEHVIAAVQRHAQDATT